MPLPEPPPTLVQAPRWAGIGLLIPIRCADCSGDRPSWYPFQVNVCDCDDDPCPHPYEGRHLTVPPPATVLPWPAGDPCAGDC